VFEMWREEQTMRADTSLRAQDALCKFPSVIVLSPSIVDDSHGSKGNAKYQLGAPI